MTMLDVGCGWGSMMKRAVEKYDVNVVGLTLSKNRYAYCRQVLEGIDSKRSKRALLSDWAEFDEPVDRIVTIEALEHFGFHRYDDFFKYTYEAMPADGVMLLHSITGITPQQAAETRLAVVVRDGPLHQIHHDRHLPGWPAAVGREGRRARDEGRFRGEPRSSRCSPTSPGPSTCGPRYLRRTRTRPSRSSPKRSTSGT